MRFVLSVLACCTILLSCDKKNILSEDLKYPFDMYLYDGGVFISNLGGDSINYNNDSQDGFISYYKNGKTQKFIPPGSGLYAPKGITVKDNCLFVADRNTILAFDINTKKKIDKIVLPQPNAFVCDLEVLGSAMFISVVNHDKIYILNIENPYKIDHSSLLEYIDIPFPSTMKAMGNNLFVASNPFGSSHSEERHIYIISDLNNPSVRTLFHEEGNYQGIEFTPKKRRLLFCNQQKRGYLGNVVFENSEYNYENIGDKNSIFTSLLLIDNKLFICDMFNSQIFVKSLIEYDNFPNVIESDI